MPTSTKLIDPCRGAEVRNLRWTDIDMDERHCSKSDPEKFLSKWVDIFLEWFRWVSWILTNWCLIWWGSRFGDSSGVEKHMTESRHFAVAEATTSCILIFNKVAVDPLEGPSLYYAIFFERMLRVPNAWTLVTPIDGHGTGQQETLRSYSFCSQHCFYDNETEHFGSSSV